MTFRKYHGNIAHRILVTSPHENGNSTNPILLLQNESLWSEKKADRLMTRSEERQVPDSWPVWEQGTFLHSQASDIHHRLQGRGEERKWPGQQWLFPDFTRRWGCRARRGCGYRHLAPLCAARRESTFSGGKVYSGTQMGINFGVQDKRLMAYLCSREVLRILYIS